MNITELKDIPYNVGLYYLASPYGSVLQDLIDKRMEVYERVDAALIQRFRYTMSPLDKHYKLKHGNIPGDYKFWKDYCMRMLRLSCGLIVIVQEGWSDSRGVQDEIETARTIGLPVYYVEPV